MSAFLVSKATIDVLVTAAIRLDRYDSIPFIPTETLIADPVAFRALVEPLPQAAGAPVIWRPRSIAGRNKWLGYESELGRALWLANLASLKARYGADDSDDELPAIRAYKWTQTVRSAVQVIKDCHCLDYQSCEVRDWESTWAKSAIDAIERVAVRSLPGYEEAKWGEI